MCLCILYNIIMLYVLYMLYKSILYVYIYAYKHIKLYTSMYYSICIYVLRFVHFWC